MASDGASTAAELTPLRLTSMVEGASITGKVAVGGAVRASFSRGGEGRPKAARRLAPGANTEAQQYNANKNNNNLLPDTIPLRSTLCHTSISDQRCRRHVSYTRDIRNIVKCLHDTAPWDIIDVLFG